MKFRFAAVAAVAAAFACSSVPLVASADFGSFSSVEDYSNELSSISPELQSIPGGPQLWAVIQTVRMCLDNPVDTGGSISFTNSQTIAGYYYHDDDTTPHLVTVYGFPDNYQYHPSDGRFTVYASDEFTVEALCITSAQNVGTRYQLASGWYSFEFVPIGERATWQVYADNYFTPLSYSLDNVTTMTARISTSSSPVILHPADFGLYFSPHIPSPVGGQAFTVTMPDGDLDPDNPWTYIQDSVKPYFQTNYPETEPYLPDDPWQPIYPTGETLVGIPKEWTVENPQLPTSPEIDFDPGSVDLTLYDPVTPIVDNLESLDFWWWLTENVLDCLHLGVYVGVFVSLGIVWYILWALGK